jgi:hypothetical protein
MKNSYSEKSEENSITAGNEKNKSGIKESQRPENPLLSNIINGRDCEKPAENIRRSQVKYIIKK